LIAVANVPGKDEIMREQMNVFKAALPHIDRAVRIHSELRIRDLDHDTAPDRLENLQRSVLLVDGAAQCGCPQTAWFPWRPIIKAGSLHSIGDSDGVQGLIASYLKWSRRTHFNSTRPAPITPTGDGDAVAVKGHRRETSLAWLGHSRGHCHRRRSGQGKMDAITGRGSLAG
jgi:hypothetical protein